MFDLGPWAGNLFSWSIFNMEILPSSDIIFKKRRRMFLMKKYLERFYSITIFSLVFMLIGAVFSLNVYAKPVEVSLWHYFEHEAEALEKVVADYNAMQDEIEVIPTFVSREELMNQYTIGAISGELPDIGMVDSPNMASFIALGVFADITEYVEEWDDLQYFYDGPLNSTMDVEGNIHGLPNNSNCLALLVNMDILEASGFDEPPTTWDEFYEIAAATTDPSNSIYGFSMSAVGNEEGTFQFIPWLYASGASISSLVSEKAISSLELLTNLVKEGYMSREVINWGQGDAYNAFVAGKAAMLESGTWQIATMDEDIDDAFDYQYTLLPKGEEYASVIGGENFGVTVAASNIEACTDFIKFMQTAENNANWCEIAGKLPVRSDAAELKDFWTEDERYAVFTDAMNYAVARGPHPEWPIISEAIYSAVQAALIGEKTPEQAMKDAAAIINPILAEIPVAGSN
ncbi:ABC transporter substrate-binding protein [Halocella sp. SP3-1]|nr:ABC transporter substrate-binding protein [Halocella sp. SP3-1]